MASNPNKHHQRGSTVPPRHSQPKKTAKTEAALSAAATLPPGQYHETVKKGPRPYKRYFKIGQQGQIYTSRSVTSGRSVVQTIARAPLVSNDHPKHSPTFIVVDIRRQEATTKMPIRRGSTTVGYSATSKIVNSIITLGPTGNPYDPDKQLTTCMRDYVFVTVPGDTSPANRPHEQYSAIRPGDMVAMVGQNLKVVNADRHAMSKSTKTLAVQGDRIYILSSTISSKYHIYNVDRRNEEIWTAARLHGMDISPRIGTFFEYPAEREGSRPGSAMSRSSSLHSLTSAASGDENYDDEEDDQGFGQSPQHAGRGRVSFGPGRGGRGMRPRGK